MQGTLLHTIMVPIQLIGEIWSKIHNKTVGDAASKYILIVSDSVELQETLLHTMMAEV